MMGQERTQGGCHARRRSTSRIFAACAALGFCGLLCAWFFRPALVEAARAFDERHAGLKIRDVWGRLRWHEDWSEVPSASGYDFRWIGSGGFLRIAHALGAARGPEQNSLAAARRSVSQGFTLLEVDVWRDDAGRLQCRHGEDAGVPAGAQPVAVAECAVPELLRTLRDWQDVYLVPDIKTDFAATVPVLLAAAREAGVERRLVMQLYEPAHLLLFARWQPEHGLPGPIVTTYLSHLPIWRVQPTLERKGYRAIAMPLDAMSFATPPHANTALLVHPVHDCATLGRARAAGMRGAYMLNSLAC